MGVSFEPFWGERGGREKKAWNDGVGAVRYVLGFVSENLAPRCSGCTLKYLAICLHVALDAGERTNAVCR